MSMTPRTGIPWSRYHPVRRLLDYPVTGAALSATANRTPSCRWRIEVGADPAQLIEHYQAIHRDRMQGLGLCNPHLSVEGVGFAPLDEHQLGVLITPWFMNLILLPGNDEWRHYEPGGASDYGLPAGPHEFTTCHDDALGTYLTAVLFRSMLDIPNQSVARNIAAEILTRLRTVATKTGQPERTRAGRSITRRDLLGVGQS